jgi:hypothetical protein
MAAWLSLLALAGTAGAATPTVTNLNHSGAGSLRDSIASASAGDQIQFQGRGERRFVYADEQHLIGQFGRYLP